MRERNANHMNIKEHVAENHTEPSLLGCHQERDERERVNRSSLLSILLVLIFLLLVDIVSLGVSRTGDGF